MGTASGELDGGVAWGESARGVSGAEGKVEPVLRDYDLFSDGDWAHTQQELGLSPRQEEIIRLVLEGNADKQIAQKLNISMTTVRTHLHRLFEKFKLNDRLELTLLVLTSLRGRLGRSPARPRPDVPNSVRHPDSDAVLADSFEKDEQGPLRDEDTVQ